MRLGDDGIIANKFVRASKNGTVTDHLIAGTVALGDGSIEDNKRMAVLTISVVLWSFLAIIPFIQVRIQ